MTDRKLSTAAEEIKDASVTLPLAMIWTLFLNGITGLVMIITFAFCLQDIDKALASETGFPFISVFLDATGSVGATAGMTVVIMVMQFFSAISNVATTSRQLYAFSRDNGVPFSKTLSTINPRLKVPVNALLTSLVIVCLLALINIGSSVAFNAIMSLGTASLQSSYIASTGCLCLRRLRKQPLPEARWSMGVFSLPVDIFATLFLILSWVFCFFPLARPVTLENMNWSIVVFWGVVLLSLSYYVLYGKNRYTGPVKRVKAS